MMMMMMMNCNHKITHTPAARKKKTKVGWFPWCIRWCSCEKKSPLLSCFIVSRLFLHCLHYCSIATLSECNVTKFGPCVCFSVFRIGFAVVKLNTCTTTYCGLHPPSPPPLSNSHAANTYCFELTSHLIHTLLYLTHTSLLFQSSCTWIFLQKSARILLFRAHDDRRLNVDIWLTLHHSLLIKYHQQQPILFYFTDGDSIYAIGFLEILIEKGVSFISRGKKEKETTGNWCCVTKHLNLTSGIGHDGLLPDAGSLVHLSRNARWRM